MNSYDFKAQEEKWHARWEEMGLYRTSDSPKNKYYVLEMFAYPSGDIHIGHFRNYSIGDVAARYEMMRGKDVLHPFGWDAFGQPAEGAAIKHKIHPGEWTAGNIETGKKTLQSMAISYDWDREIRTCEPDYYRWTQWVFLQLFKAGLAYQSSSMVNWCDQCQTILADEQAAGGECWRCKGLVIKKWLDRCWFFKYSEYAGRLLQDLDQLKKWPENVKSMQRNWIGKSKGSEIDFELDTGEKVSVFTTRPDTIYGVTFMALSPESPLASQFGQDNPEVEAYIQMALKRSEVERAKAEKDGVFTGHYVINPYNGEKAQLWVADYVLAGYGTGLVMGVPAHDQRDFEFAKKYDIPITVVIGDPDSATMTEAFVEDGPMQNSGPFDGIGNREGIKKVTEYGQEKSFGRFKTNYKLRDWLVSRQRYWGCPIPIIHCSKCGPQAVPEDQLPVVLPKDVESFMPKGRSPLGDHPTFSNATCPACGAEAERDLDTMDTFMCSSWYQNRYVDAKNENAPWDKEAAKTWLPVDLYIGGVEHACGHLMYFRFITKVLFDQGWLPVEEPVVRLFNHGMVKDKTGQIMSKSIGNVISPKEVMEKWGVDVCRLAMFFFAPSGDEIKWDPQGLAGANRFMTRLWKFMSETLPKVKDVSGKPEKPEGSFRKIRRKTHQLIRKTTDAAEGDLAFNTVISTMMELLNLIDQEKAEPKTEDDLRVLRETADALARTIAPLAPFVAEEFWEGLGGKKSVFQSGWPVFDAEALKLDELQIVVQVNGKVRGKVTVPASASDEDVRTAALSEEKIQSALSGKEPRKVIVIKGRLVNIVV